MNSIFDSCFSQISESTRSSYAISDADLLGMVSREFYTALNNPEIAGPASMLASLEKEQGSQNDETESLDREARIQQYILREEMRLLNGECDE